MDKVKMYFTEEELEHLGRVLKIYVGSLGDAMQKTDSDDMKAYFRKDVRETAKLLEKFNQEKMRKFGVK